MGKGHEVTGAAVVLKNEDGSDRYLYRGATFAPGSYTRESIEHAVSVGLLTEIADGAAEPAGSGDAGDDRPYPEGDPTVDWKGKELDAWAAERGYESVAKASSKADKVAAIEKDAKAAAEAAAAQVAAEAAK